VDDAETMFQVLNDERLHEFFGGRPLSVIELRARSKSWSWDARRTALRVRARIETIWRAAVGETQ
jgi:hypothetical protein